MNDAQHAMRERATGMMKMLLCSIQESAATPKAKKIAQGAIQTIRYKTQVNNAFFFFFQVQKKNTAKVGCCVDNENAQRVKMLSKGSCLKTATLKM